MFISCIANSNNGGTRQWVAIAFNNWLGVYLKGLHMEAPQVMSTHIIYTCTLVLPQQEVAVCMAPI